MKAPEHNRSHNPIKRIAAIGVVLGASILGIVECGNGVNISLSKNSGASTDCSWGDTGDICIIASRKSQISNTKQQNFESSIIFGKDGARIGLGSEISNGIDRSSDPLGYVNGGYIYWGGYALVHVPKFKNEVRWAFGVWNGTAPGTIDPNLKEENFRFDCDQFGGWPKCERSR